MSLQPLQFDDLTWSQMVDAIRARIAANSNGEWTMHGPLDPGVTLLELFAYLFEQRLYWLDQLPEPLVRAILAMLDDAPLTTTSAKTVLVFRLLEDGSPRRIDTGTVFYPRDRALQLPFSTLEPVTVLPVSYVDDVQPRIDLIASDRNNSADLRAGRLIPLMPADGSAAELQLIIWLGRVLHVDEINGEFNLFFELETMTAIKPEWAPLPNDIQWFDRIPPTGYSRDLVTNDDIAASSCSLARSQIDTGTDHSSGPTSSSEPRIWINNFIAREWSHRHLLVEVPATLKWHYSTGAGTRKAFAFDQLEDATGGLRRSGLVRFKIPADWKPISVSADGPVGYGIVVTCEACTYSSPPRLRRIIPNAAVAQHALSVDMGWSMIKPQLVNWLRLPGQTLQLPLDKPEPLEKSVYLLFRESDGYWHEWRPTDHFYHHGPEDRVFMVDRQRKQLIFGDGLRGRIPVLEGNAEPWAKLCYLAGGGNWGNVGELIWASSTTDLQPMNPVVGIGGAEAETLAEAKARVGRDLSRCERAVIPKDFEWLAISTPGIAIARAHAAVGYHPGFPCHPVAGAITVFVVPHVPRNVDLFASGEAVLAPQTDPGALAEVSRRINTRRLLTTEVYVRSVHYRAVRLLVGLQGIFSDEAALQAEMALMLMEYLDPLIGGDQGEGWPFGGSLRPSSLVNRLQHHLDDGIIVKRVAISLDTSNFFEDCHDVSIGAHELVYLQQVSFSVERTPTTQGGLR